MADVVKKKAEACDIEARCAKTQAARLVAASASALVLRVLVSLAPCPGFIRRARTNVAGSLKKKVLLLMQALGSAT